MKGLEKERGSESETESVRGRGSVSGIGKERRKESWKESVLGSGREKEKEKRRGTAKESEIVTMIERGRESGSEIGKKSGSEREKSGSERESESGRGNESESGNEREREKGIKNESVRGIGKTKTKDEMTAEKSGKIPEKTGIPEMDTMRESQRNAIEMKGVLALVSHLSAGENILLTVMHTTAEMIKMKNIDS